MNLSQIHSTDTVPPSPQPLDLLVPSSDILLETLTLQCKALLPLLNKDISK